MEKDVPNSVYSNPCSTVEETMDVNYFSQHLRSSNKGIRER